MSPALVKCSERCDATWKSCQKLDPARRCYEACNAKCTAPRSDGSVPTVNEEGDCYNACAPSCDTPGAGVDCNSANRECLNACPDRDGACLFAGDPGCEAEPTGVTKPPFDEAAALARLQKVMFDDCGSDGRGAVIVTWADTGKVERVHVNWGQQPSNFGAVNSCVKERFSHARIPAFSDGYPNRDEPTLRTRELRFGPITLGGK